MGEFLDNIVLDHHLLLVKFE